MCETSKHNEVKNIKPEQETKKYLTDVMKLSKNINEIKKELESTENVLKAQTYNEKINRGEISKDDIPNKVIEREELREALLNAIAEQATAYLDLMRITKNIPFKEAVIVLNRYGKAKSIKEISEQQKLSEARINQLLTKALKTLHPYIPMEYRNQSFTGEA